MNNPCYRQFTGLLAGLFLLSAISIAQVPKADVVSVWLQSDCGVGDTGQLATQLEQAGPAIEPALISAAQNGPDADALLQIQQGAATLYELLQDSLATDGVQIGLTANEIQVIQTQTREQFVASAVQDATLAYQSRALGGLGVIGDNNAVQVLQTYAGNSASPLQSVAAGVLAEVFSAFSGQLEISKRGFEFKSTFSLRTNSDGIDPVAETVNLQIGTFSAEIPSGSFNAKKNGSFTFEGVINGANLEIQIRPLGSNGFPFTAEGSGIDLTGLTNPVTVVLTIGNDKGRITVRAEHD